MFGRSMFVWFNVLFPLIPNTALVHVNDLRIPGVLQRLALSYFVVAILEVCFAKAADFHQVSQETLQKIPEEIAALFHFSPFP